MFCNQCGESVPDGSLFCQSCRARTGQVTVVTSSFNYGMAGRIAAIIGGVLIVTGSLLPWATANDAVRSYAYDGMDGAGAISMALGLLIIIGASSKTISKAFN